MKFTNPYLKALPRGLLGFVGLLANTLAALLVPAVLEVTADHALPVHSVSQFALRSLALSMTLSFTTGFFAYRTLETRTAKWIWLLPTLLFSIRALGYLLTPAPGSVMEAHSSRLGMVWTQMSGVGCSEGWHSMGCMNFYLFTLEFVRCTGYSVGALFCERQFSTQGFRQPPPSKNANVEQ
jgi:hypothetical protein